MAINSKIKLFRSTKRVKPWSGPMRLGAGELELFDALVTEHIRICGTRMDYYHTNIEESERDPVYDESVSRVFDGPFRVPGYISFPSASTQAGEEGFRVQWDCTAFIARKELDDIGAPPITEGDIIRVWDIPFFTDYKAPGSGYFFSVLNSKDAGHLFDNAQFVGFEVVLQRRSEFTPERLIIPDE